MRRWIMSPHTAPALIGVAAFLLVIAAIDPAGDYPNMPEGPGLTIDESFNVEQGVRLVEGLKAWGLGAISLRELFGDPRDLGPRAEFGYHNPDHPPLGRLWLGLWHRATLSIAPPRRHDGPFVTACARVGSAAAFGITVFLCGWAAAAWYGGVAGAVASMSLLLMPRVFGHAHLAALETCIGLTYLIAILVVARTWTGRAPVPALGSRSGIAVSWWFAAMAGIALGGAMLTKIQGVLLVVPVSVWAFAHWRLRGVRPLLIWGLVGLATFFLFWPWLWFDPVGRFQEYLGRTTQRVELNVWYFGQRYADRDVPWHFPAIMFLSTVPIGLQLLGFLGVFGGRDPIWKERPAQLLLGAIVFPLVLFSLPRIAVYDGDRLFLVVFPLWAIVIGRGGALAWQRLAEKIEPARASTNAGKPAGLPKLRSGRLVLTCCFVALQGWGIVATWPCFLSYYNITVGGLRGAKRLGLELDYWGEAVTRDFLERVVQTVPDGARIDVAPVLHQFQLSEMIVQSPVLRHRGIVLSPYDRDAPMHSDYLIVFGRMADLSPHLRKLIEAAPAVIEVRRRGVRLAGLFDTRSSPEPQTSRSEGAALGGALAAQ